MLGIYHYLSDESAVTESYVGLGPQVRIILEDLRLHVL
jgi:hypothetical protein